MWDAGVLSVGVAVETVALRHGGLNVCASRQDEDGHFLP